MLNLKMSGLEIKLSDHFPTEDFDVCQWEEGGIGANYICFTRHHLIVHISHTRHMGNFYHKITFFTIMVI